MKWIYGVLGVGLLVVTAPFAWLLLSSIKPESEIRQQPPTFLPRAPTVDNYTLLFEKLDLATYFTNSVVVALTITAGNLLFCSMLGYALAKLEFPGKKLIFMLVMGKLMVPHVVIFVPLFVVVAGLGMANTKAGLIVPFLASAFGVFLMRQFIVGLPDEVLDAARIDGAGEWRNFARVVMPLCKPALATLGILTFLSSWNAFLWPLVVAQTQDTYTLPVAIALFSMDHFGTEYGVLLAGAVTLVVPIIVVFLFFQRHLVQGIATTGLK